MDCLEYLFIDCVVDLQRSDLYSVTIFQVEHRRLLWEKNQLGECFDDETSSIDIDNSSVTSKPHGHTRLEKARKKLEVMTFLNLELNFRDSAMLLCRNSYIQGRIGLKGYILFL